MTPAIETLVFELAPGYLISEEETQERFRFDLESMGVVVLDGQPRAKLTRMEEIFSTSELLPGISLGVACAVVKQRGGPDYQLISMASFQRYF